MQNGLQRTLLLTFQRTTNMDATPVFKVDYKILTFIHMMLDAVNI